jgi:hypothetical protein
MACACVGVNLMYYFFAHEVFQIVNCLHEWHLGYEVKAPFTGARYQSVHEAMICLMGKLEQHDYHGPKLTKLLEGIANDGQ